MFTTVDKHLGLPIYIQIMNMVKKEILLGNFVEGDQLPPVRELSKTFGANINTVMRALEKLGNEGVVESRHGIGYFIHATDSIARDVIEEAENFVEKLKKRDIDLPMTKMIIEEVWKKI
ncbi:MAG TPA: winged helix-turn-helix domain-containing protein [Thermotogota bacterium]|nr:winged helix-turn-helix domain-containing protein [Thermotogota bacterium]HPJ87910.1 winged helix-turn-helix domain-containing protein [Thermotogota bacterium]HPR95003.1 winged helix-turn-helix domain-containing protein [Thermotogota bacterium]